MPSYGNRYRRRLGGSGFVAPFGRPLYPVPFARKRKYPSTVTGAPLRLGRRVRPKLGGSFTRTVRKRKRNFGHARKTGDNSSISATYLGRRWDSKVSKIIMDRILAMQVRNTNNVTSVISTQGQQAIMSFDIFGRGDLNEITKIANGTPTTFPENPIKIFLKGVKSKLFIRNQLNSVVRMTMYDIVTTRTTPGTGYDDPIEAWQKGLTDLGSTGAEKNVGATPYISPEFRQYYKVQKVTTVNLEAGQQHEHNVYFAVNRVCDSTRWSNYTSNAIGQLTHFTMVVWHGSLGHENLTPANVSYLAARLDFAQHLEYKYGVLEKKSPALSNNYTLPNVTDFDFMGENQDQDANMTNA